MDFGGEPLPKHASEGDGMLNEFSRAWCNSGRTEGPLFQACGPRSHSWPYRYNSGTVSPQSLSTPPPCPPRGASQYRGVTKHHQHGKWEARIGRVDGSKYLYLGTFESAEEAARAYDRAAVKFRGRKVTRCAVTGSRMHRDPRRTRFISAGQADNMASCTAHCHACTACM